MAYRVEIDRRAQKALAVILKSARKDFERIEKAIDNLAKDPRPPGVKRLTSRAPGFRMRVGEYRVIYAIFDTDELVKVALVARRGERTYDDLERLLGT
ncbi:MAG TPA: type II toxin-antitoxin system RelE/ParE family toxin [Dehalococcoidia bacterium]|nr:type II toxin-antitoxin system RelE/ParE family toxin [Dehalococcoidia bacterium]